MNHRFYESKQGFWTPKPTSKKRLLLLVVTLLCTQPLWAARQTAAVGSNPNRIVVWDGETHDMGSSWVNPTTSTFSRTQGDAHSGNTALDFKFHDRHAWLGCGFDWFDWKAGRDVGTNTSDMTNLNFWIKSKGAVGDLELQLLCNGDVIDTPEHHAPKMRVAKYCPNFRDGKWHEVVIPLRDMAYPTGYDPKVVTMIDFGFWSEGESSGSFLIDDIAFDNRPLHKKISK
jgi:hypothetical protein